MEGDVVTATMETASGGWFACKMDVLEQIHCVVGPAFADIC